MNSRYLEPLDWIEKEPMRQYAFAGRETCPLCEGTGWKDVGHYVACPACNGCGWRERKSKLCLAAVKGGALIERFDRELDKLLQALSDAEAPPPAAEIVLTMRIMPNRACTCLAIEGGVRTRPCEAVQWPGR